MELRTRRILLWTLLGIAILALFAAGTAILFPNDSSVSLLEGALVVLLLALAGEVVLILMARAEAPQEPEEEWTAAEAATASPSAAQGPASPAPAPKPLPEILLRCTSCGNVFTVVDTGERPLRHACPHCGRVGILRDVPADAAPPGGAASP
ncbi:MAG: FmdB family zinc ribbon protein [Thermoplasmatota archaeon]